MSDKYLETVINDLADMYGPEVVVTEVTRLLGPVTPSPTNRGPQTARAAGVRRRQQDLAQFSSRSLPGRLMGAFKRASVNAVGLTAHEAARSILSVSTHHTQFEGCRRRVSDLVKVGYLTDSGERRSNSGASDPAIVWRITPLGVSAVESLIGTGWARPRNVKQAA